MEGSITELSKYRCENRAYYSIFHAMKSVNALSGYDSSKHRAILKYGGN